MTDPTFRVTRCGGYPMHAPAPPVLTTIGPPDFKRLLDNPGTVQVRHGACSVSTSADGLNFVLTGPSGTHMLATAGTDIARLNAHWRTFVTHERNRPAVDLDEVRRVRAMGV